MEQEGFTLHDILTQEDVVQDLRGYNQALVDLCVRCAPADRWAMAPHHARARRPAWLKMNR